MIGNVHGPWLPGLAFFLLYLAARAAAPPSRRDLGIAASVVGIALCLRWAFGLWGPLHVNGQGPLWIRGAIEDHALLGYGPGYFELLGWATRLARSSWLTGLARPDAVVFGANLLLSALSPALLYTAARLAGSGYAGALGMALVLATDVVTVRIAATEVYISGLVFLWLATATALALASRLETQGKSRATGLAMAAAALFAAAAARLHPMIYLPLALTPLVAFAAVQGEGLLGRLRFALLSAAAIGAVVLLTSLDTILTALAASPMTSHAFFPLRPEAGRWLVAGLALVLVLQWRSPSAWLGLVALASAVICLTTQDSFQQHPFWKLCYQRVHLPAVLLGTAWILPRRWRALAWGLLGALPAVALLAWPARDLVRAHSTEQREYRFLRQTLGDMPAGCAVAAVSRAGYRIWEIPSFLVPGREGRMPAQRALQEPKDLAVLAGSEECLIYIHSSLCNAVEGRDLCARIEASVPLRRVAAATFPAAPSYLGLPYDREQVEVGVFRVETRVAPATREGSSQPAPRTLSDGAPITPELAKSIFDLVAPLREADGCRLSQFDTGRFRIAAAITNAAGREHIMEIASAAGSADQEAGGWAVAVPAALQADCAATVAAFKKALAQTPTPQGSAFGPAGGTRHPPIVTLLAISFLLLVLGTLHILGRELRSHPPAWTSLAALLGVSGLGLGLRLLDSPRTFLHEYFHIAETISAYLTGAVAPVYGNTGPALYRLFALLAGAPEDVEIVFLTNAVLSSLAVPALILFDYQRQGGWARALAAGLMLCVLPVHLRFSAAEDLFVVAVTFGLWSLALVASYLRTRRLEDALLAALALSLAVQARPEMVLFPGLAAALVLLDEPRPWRIATAWPTLGALLLLVLLLIPRALELRASLASSPAPGLHLPDAALYLRSLVLFDPQVTPRCYAALVALGLLWGLWQRPRYYAWLGLVFLGFTLFSQSLFHNPIYNVRSQVLPMSFTPLLAAGCAAAWIEWSAKRRHLARLGGALVWLALAVSIWSSSRHFVHELRDQQQEWAFLQRAVSALPPRAVLLTAVEAGGHRIDAFPRFLLTGQGKRYELVDVNDAAAGRVAWPEAGEDVLFYQGMFCHFAFAGEARPQPLIPACVAVHERYRSEAVLVEDIPGPAYSLLEYAGDGRGPFRIGFYRLETRRPSQATDDGEEQMPSSNREGRSD